MLLNDVSGIKGRRFQPHHHERPAPCRPSLRLIKHSSLALYRAALSYTSSCLALSTYIALTLHLMASQASSRGLLGGNYSDVPPPLLALFDSHHVFEGLNLQSLSEVFFLTQLSPDVPQPVGQVVDACSRRSRHYYFPHLFLDSWQIFGCQFVNSTSVVEKGSMLFFSGRPPSRQLGMPTYERA